MIVTYSELSSNKKSACIDYRQRKTQNLESFASFGRLIVEATMFLYDRITDSSLLVRRITIGVLCQYVW
ncbi:MAG: hypothetical protein HUJ72_01780 [Blautia sp.]|nr:hypothetical protein [Blautia sp.]